MTTILRVPQITLDEIRDQIRKTNFVCYGANTCWWNCDVVYTRPIPDKPNQPGLPCDPRDGMLFQVDGAFVAGGERHDPLQFIAKALETPDYYGRHGIGAFVAAYHGNVLRDGRPWCFREWGEYNALLDSVLAEAKP